MTETRRSYDVLLTPEHVRRWQLARTIPHEVGHWVDYRHRGRARPHREREQFADRYADNAEPAVRKWHNV